MKLSTLMIGGLGMLSMSAFAQSSVTLYGVIDTGIEYVSHANTGGGKVIRMPGITGELPSRWGLRGSEDLGGGLKTVFQLENGFNPRGGDMGQGGRLFGRQAWVGLQGPWGQVSLGRQYSMTFWGLTDSDILGPDIYGSASLDAYIPNARSDNTIAYMGAFHGLTLGATYSLGRDSAGTGNSPGQGTCAGQVAGHFPQCRQWSAMVKYDTSAFGASALSAAPTEPNCRAIETISARLSCYDAAFPPKVKKPAKTAIESSSGYTDPFLAEEARSTAKLKNICRGC